MAEGTERPDRPAHAESGSQHGSHNRQVNYFKQQSQLLLLVAVFGGIALVLYLWTNLGRTTAAGPAPTATVTVTAPAPHTGAAPAPATAGSTGGAGGGWKQQYGGKPITVPPPEKAPGLCTQSFADFALLPRAGQGGGTAAGLGGEHDLLLYSTCGALYREPTLEAAGESWGQADTDQPPPEQCQDQAASRALQQKLLLSDVHEDTAYCLVTEDKRLVWLKVTGKAGSDGAGLDLLVTLWTR